MASPYTVLVTGSAGHLGAALMLSLPSLGHVPHGIDILPSPTTTTLGSITDRALIASLLADNPSITHIVHAATLHKPHVDSHPKSAFIDTNITGTLVLLEEAAAQQNRIKSFLFISTTSTFGRALAPAPGQPAAWITESVTPLPKNIYGVTKCAAEDLCSLIHRQTSLPVLVLRTSRFFPEPDDDEDRRAAMPDDANLKVCELAYRRVDIADVVSAVVCGMEKAESIGFGKYIISAPPPFAAAAAAATNDDGGEAARATLLRRLDSDAGAVVAEAVPGCAAVFEKLGWRFLDRLDRVYDSSRAVRELGWRPQWTMEKVVERLARGEDWRSELTHAVGKKGYHAVSTGVYTSRD
ncbi:NAD-dependent epimerase dehydratase [Colletotrichum scovillei]|uniref:NAD-dependent epimerase dehydratase n=1 Tax=Colletotrichum scovillei TaxID=1209932 RepID=UPI0015C3B4CB|nr:NAD-dependent epimerase dehydratase [Colletotrichum scovillei]KAF4776771.1 NAD-dependent epimerase dehydratase [Colletotrichum scovillei]